MPLQQTEIGLRYTTGFIIIRSGRTTVKNPVDQTHQLDLWLDHAFTPRWEAKLEDTLSVAQDPALTAVGTATPQRVDGNNLANTVNASLHTDWTRLFGTELTYQNSFYDYDSSGGTANNPSYAGLLNRVEQNFGLELQWAVLPTTTALVGYKFGMVNFTGNEQIALNTTVVPNISYNSDSRNNRSQYGYVGVQHTFLENLTGNVNVGVQYTDYYNDPSSTSSLGPYADASMIYTYAVRELRPVGGDAISKRDGNGSGGFPGAHHHG